MYIYIYIFKFQVVIEVHNEDRRPSSLQQLQEFLENKNISLTSIPQEKDGFLSRKVGYEIERRLVKAVQVRTLKKKKQKKGHYHYYPFYEKENSKGILYLFSKNKQKNIFFREMATNGFFFLQVFGIGSNDISIQQTHLILYIITKRKNENVAEGIIDFV